jgi:hypothetical protein
MTIWIAFEVGRLYQIHRPGLCVRLWFSGEVDEAARRDALFEFLSRCERRVQGSEWYKLPDDRQLRALAVYVPAGEEPSHLDVVITGLASSLNFVRAHGQELWCQQPSHDRFAVRRVEKISAQARRVVMSPQVDPNYNGLICYSAMFRGIVVAEKAAAERCKEARPITKRSRGRPKASGPRRARRKSYR